MQYINYSGMLEYESLEENKFLILRDFYQVAWCMCFFFFLSHEILITILIFSFLAFLAFLAKADLLKMVYGKWSVLLVMD